jgi:hypothetical protein
MTKDSHRWGSSQAWNQKQVFILICIENEIGAWLYKNAKHADSVTFFSVLGSMLP